MEGSFLTLAAPGDAETRVRDSSFLALAAPAADETAARSGSDATAGALVPELLEERTLYQPAST